MLSQLDAFSLTLALSRWEREALRCPHDDAHAAVESARGLAQSKTSRRPGAAGGLGLALFRQLGPALRQIPLHELGVGMVWPQFL